jgi:Ca2+-binding RTX toxin-like protein
MALNEATTHLSNGTLRVFGTMGDDNTRIYRAPADPTRLTVVLNGVRKTFALADVQNIYVYGYSGDDSIAVYEGHGQVLARSHMWGGYGDDTLYTGSARDTVYGEEGNDYLSGGRNNDSIDGGDGNDTIDCGAGNDTACGDNGSDNLIGGAGLDMLSGGTDGCKDQINGGAGQDVIFGNAVIDIFYGASLGDDAPSADQILSG